MYSDKVLDHFHHPRNAGELAEPSAAVEVTNPVCGDMLKLWVVVHQGRIAETGFKIEGCVPAVACASLLTEMMKGKTLPELRLITAGQIETGLDGLPSGSKHASALAVGALQQVLKELT